MSPKLIMLAATLAVGAAVPAAAQYGHNEFSANLRGNAEVPGPGKMNASGMTTVQVNPGRNRICYRINSQNIPRATMAHIHSGRAGVEGPPVVTLRVNSSGEGNSCVGVSRRSLPGAGRFTSPSGPSSLNRCTQSRSVWRSMPPSRAASSRLIPS